MTIKLFNNKTARIIFFIVFFIKLVIFNIIIQNIAFGGDADFYNLVATGFYGTSNFTNYFAKILYILNEYGLYNREYFKYLIFFISSIFIPILFSYNTLKMIHFQNNSLFWNISLLISVYPTLFIFSLDIYRDIPMVFIFLIAITFMNLSIKSNKYFNKILFLFIFIIISIHLYDWRHYLAASMLISAFIYPIIKMNLFSFRMLILLYFILLGVAYYIGLANDIIVYRLGFEDGGSTLGIQLAGNNLIKFYLLYIYSSFLQLFSLYLVNIEVLFFFILESIPFFISLFYIIKNKIYLSNFHKFLLTFFIIYGTIWLLGNDNLGTAIRLRMFNYLVIFMIAISIYHNKKYITKRGYV